MARINIEQVTILCIVAKKDWFILKRIRVFIWYNILKKLLSPENFSFISLMMIMQNILKATWNRKLSSAKSSKYTDIILSPVIRYILLMFSLLKENFLLPASFLSSKVKLNVFNQH